MKNQIFYDRLPDLVQEIMLKPKPCPKEERSNNFGEREKKNRSEGIQPILVAKVTIFYINSNFLLESTSVLEYGQE